MSFEWAARPEFARAIIAGWLTGAAVGLACLAILMIGLSREPDWYRRFPGLHVSLPVLGIIAANATLIGWTLIGVLLGFLYPLLPTPAFSIVVIAAGAGLGAAYRVVRGPPPGAEGGIVWTSLACATLLFAGFMPVLLEVL